MILFQMIHYIERCMTKPMFIPIELHHCTYPLRARGLPIAIAV